MGMVKMAGHKSGELTDREIEQKRKAAIKHDGEGAINAIQAGKSFTGLALEAQKDVETRLELEGRAAVMKSTAVRVQACVELYWNAIAALRQDGGNLNLVKLDTYIQRLGWLAGVAMRSWDLVGKTESKIQRETLSELLGVANDKTS
jgi:hypothetical protein